MAITRLARRKGFQCMHRYSVSAWTAEKNAAEFGACFTPTGHGHNYELEVFFEGAIDPVSGMIANLQDIDVLLGELLAPVAGKHLNEEVPEFKNTVPTTEALAGFLTARLLKINKLNGVRVAKLRLYEYENLWVDVWP
jgi:6-pyruvoyltetrahydropterin/6-carboxytetrahydropterin synthase